MYIEYFCAFLMITMKDIGVIFKSRVPVSPVYINALVLFNGKSLPTFVNHTIRTVTCIIVSKMHSNEAILFFL